MTLQGKSPLSNNHWLRVVLDEGHVIRNPNAMMSKAAHALKAERRWVVTGTPIQNSMKDMFSIISFLKLEPFTDRQWWRRTMERPISEGDQAALRYGKIISVWNILHRDESKNFLKSGVVHLNNFRYAISNIPDTLKTKLKLLPLSG